MTTRSVPRRLEGAPPRDRVSVLTPGTWASGRHAPSLALPSEQPWARVGGEPHEPGASLSAAVPHGSLGLVKALCTWPLAHGASDPYPPAQGNTSCLEERSPEHGHAQRWHGTILLSPRLCPRHHAWLCPCHHAQPAVPVPPCPAVPMSPCPACCARAPMPSLGRNPGNERLGKAILRPQSPPARPQAAFSSLVTASRWRM